MRLAVSLILIFSLSISRSLVSQQPAANRNIEVMVQAYELQRKEAATVLQNIADSIDAVVLVQQATKAGAKVIKLGAANALGSKAAATKENGFDWEMLVFPTKGGPSLDVTFSVSKGPARLQSATTVTPGKVIFLGALEDAASGAVELIFMRAAPAVSK